MRNRSRFVLGLVTAASVLLAAAPSFAAQPDSSGAPPAPAADPAPALPVPSAPPATEAPPATPAPEARYSESGADGGTEAEHTSRDPRRAEGVRLALDLGLERAIGSSGDRLNSGTPTLLPLGADVSFRTGPYLLLGFHGYAALASRDDCISGVDSCRARAYGFGVHAENSLGRGHSFQPWIRYGVGYELVYHGGAALDPAGHVYRDAVDLFDVRIGGDFIVSRGNEKKTTRIGGFLGFSGGFVVAQSGVSNQQGFGGGSGSSRNLDTASGDPHLWFVLGVRATLDP
jgi:hypothetical protein